jgi:hypothetical protein
MKFVHVSFHWNWVPSYFAIRPPPPDKHCVWIFAETEPVRTRKKRSHISTNPKTSKQQHEISREIFQPDRNNPCTADIQGFCHYSASLAHSIMKRRVAQERYFSFASQLNTNTEMSWLFPFYLSSLIGNSWSTFTHSSLSIRSATMHQSLSVFQEK